MRRWLGGAPLLALALSLCAEARAEEGPPVSPLMGTKIVSLSFRGDSPVDAGALTRLTELGPGGILTEAAIHTGLRNLFATRQFSDLSIEAAPSAGGTVVVIAFAGAPRVTAVRLAPPSLPQRARLMDAAAVAVGDFWATDRGDLAERGLVRVLKERGYFDSKARTVVEAGPDETSVDVRFDVDTGRPSKTGPPAWTGTTRPFTPEELQRVARLKGGRVYRESVARDDVERYLARYRKAGRSRAEIRFDGESNDPQTLVVTPRYSVFPGPRIVLEVSGATVSEVMKHPDSPWVKGEPPDEDALRRLKDSLLRTYQDRGYARAAINVTFETAPDQETVRFALVRGDRYTINSVEVSGVRALEPSAVKAVVSTRPRGLIETGRLVNHELDVDRDAIAALYRSNGYPDVRVDRAVVRDGPTPFTLDVEFHVAEGPRVLVSGRKLTGATSIPRPDLEKDLSVKVGAPFDSGKVDSDVALLRSLTSDLGFAESRVTANVDLVAAPPPGPLGAKVEYEVEEGERVFFGKTVIRGNRRTKLGIIERELVHKAGKPFSLTPLVESQRNLARLGVFQGVDVMNFPTDPETKTRTVVITVQEAKPWSLLYGVGAEYDASADPRFNPRFSLAVSYNNLFGRALSVGAEGRYSRRDTRVLLTARDRGLFAWRIPLSATLFRAREIRPTFEVARRGFFMDAEKRLSPRLRTTLRYQYEIVEPTAPDAIKSTLERQNQQISISSIGPGATYDSRDDPVDPRKGLFVAADLKYAFSFIAADARFLKAFVQAAIYRPYGATTIAVSVRAGAIDSFGVCDTAVNPTCPPNLEIPIVERFFAGGRTSHRAFSLDDLGIEGETLSMGKGLGGNGLLIGNLEWRVPVFGDLGISLFFDTGNVFADYRGIRLSELRNGIGLGLHYLTPVGPVRLEYGRKLDRRTGESPGEVSFSVGYPF